VLFPLAAYLRQLGLTDSARWVLKELARQHPADPVVNESLGVLYLEQASDPARDIVTRVSDMKKANKYLTRAAQSRPDDRQLAGLLRKVGADLTVMQMQASRPDRTPLSE
jgi:uncharacterized protein HemY